MKSYTVGDTGSSSKFDVVGSNRHFKRFDLVQVWSYSPYDKAGGQLDDLCPKKFFQITVSAFQRLKYFPKELSLLFEIIYF